MIRTLSLFSGIGAFERALENLNIPHEIVAYCEINKYAAKAYSLLHNVSEDKNLLDVTNVDTSKLGPIDLLTYGFPCQDISVNGLRVGLTHEGEKTRSGLVWDAHRIIEETKPAIAICENVKNLTSKQFVKEFKAILENLDAIGYNNYYKVINAKDHGVPQNRERVFIISIRKDVDKGSFIFPESISLDKRFKDVLECGVSPKYYINKDKGAEFISNHTIDPVDSDQPVRIGNIYGDRFGTGYGGNVWIKEAICPALMTAQGGGRTPMIIDKGGIRKITPREAFRLMGFTKEDSEMLSSAGLSDSQQYKMAGNSIVVNVLEDIFKELYHV